MTTIEQLENLHERSLSQSQAAKIALAREEAEQSLIAFTEYTNPLYSPARHHRLIAAKLEAVERGEIDRLMIMMPPRHGKSELASRRFTPWYLGRNSNKQIIAASYSTDLSMDFGREVRNIVNSQDFQNVFENVKLRQDSKSAERWNTNNGGSYVAAGVGTGITGRGADILLIDDPVKDRDEADSELKRNKVWNWYTSTAYTRLMPGAAIILIQTRWHEDDLAGRLIEKQKKGGDEWTILNLPAVKNGKALWPAWYPLKRLKKIKSVIGRRDWSSLYQQDPTPDDGTYFKRKDLRWYDKAPKHLQIYGASDYAVTDDGGDFTEHGVCGVDPEDNIYILDWWFDKTTTDVWINELFRLAKEYGPVEWAEESGQIEKSVGPFIKKRQKDDGNYFFRRQYASTKDKPTRAQSIRGRSQQGKIYFPIKNTNHRTEWVDHVVTQMMKFPTGKNDDAVDVLSLFGRILAHMGKGERPKEEEDPRFNDPTNKTFNEYLLENKRKRLRDE